MGGQELFVQTHGVSRGNANERMEKDQVVSACINLTMLYRINYLLNYQHLLDESLPFGFTVQVVVRIGLIS